mgnify:CR=1 FL=1
MPGNFVGKIETYAMNITHINYYSLIMASVCLALIFIWPRFCKKIPGSLIVIILATAANILLKKYTGLETDTIGSAGLTPIPRKGSLEISTMNL